MRWTIALGLTIALLAVGASAALAQEAGTDGSWTLVGGEADGKALPQEQIKDGKLILKVNRYNVKLAGEEAIKGTQKLDSTKAPKTIDITDASGPNKGKTCLGIYELKGDEFRVVFAQPGKERPKNFATAPDSGQWMHVWKRVKE